MSERILNPFGMFRLARTVFDHDVFADEPFTEREAWIWLIAEAQWAPVTLWVQGGCTWKHPARGMGVSNEDAHDRAAEALGAPLSTGGVAARRPW